MRTLSLLIGLLSANFLLAQKASPPPTAQQILDRYVKVTGGKLAYDKVKTVTMLGMMEIKGQNVRGEMKMYRVDGGKYYTVWIYRGWASRKMAAMGLRFGTRLCWGRA